MAYLLTALVNFLGQRIIIKNIDKRLADGWARSNGDLQFLGGFPTTRNSRFGIVFYHYLSTNGFSRDSLSLYAGKLHGFCKSRYYLKKI